MGFGLIPRLVKIIYFYAQVNRHLSSFGHVRVFIFACLMMLLAFLKNEVILR